jgi:hypothetical protein
MEIMTPSTNKDYEIDVWAGKLAAIYIMARASYRLFWRITDANKPFEPLLDIVSFTMGILIPCLYLFSLYRHNAKFAKWTLGIWVFWFLFLCWSVTDKFLHKPSGFWRAIFPYAVATACMIIGEMGVIRIKESDRFKIEQRVKIPESYINTRVLIATIGNIFSLVFTFTFMAFIGKYFCDFIIVHWPSLEQNRILLFYVGVVLSCYPSIILAAAVPAITSVLFERIWNLCARHNDDEPSKHNDPPATN